MVSYKVFTLFPDFIQNYIESCAPLKRGIEQNKIEIQTVNFRDFSASKHKKVDDEVYGGGPGMLLSPQPLIDSINHHKTKKSKIFFLDPKGKPFNNKMAKEISQNEEIFLVCGKYEGFDKRIFDLVEGRLISLGDFILTGGELAALAVIDASARYVQGVLESYESQEVESFNMGWLENDNYTRPRIYEEIPVPEVLFNGNHKKIEEWKLRNSIKNTIKNRPDLLKLLNLKNSEIEIMKLIIKECYDGNQYR